MVLNAKQTYHLISIILRHFLVFEYRVEFNLDWPFPWLFITPFLKNLNSIDIWFQTEGAFITLISSKPNNSFNSFMELATFLGFFTQHKTVGIDLVTQFLKVEFLCTRSWFIDDIRISFQWNRHKNRMTEMKAQWKQWKRANLLQQKPNDVCHSNLHFSIQLQCLFVCVSHFISSSVCLSYCTLCFI